MNGLKTVAWILVAGLGVYLLDRLGLWLEQRGWIYWRRTKATHSAMGSAFMALQDIFEADKAKRVIVAQEHPESKRTEPWGDPPEAPTP